MVHSKALDRSIEIDRIIGKVEGTEKGPTLIFVGGIHGNEPAGAFALKKVLSELNPEMVKGTIYGLAGNLHALVAGERYRKQDLNRLWTEERIDSLIKKGEAPANQDEKELLELYKIIHELLESEDGPFYFFDMHTTSSETVPFLTVNDSLLNRAFTEQYPVPIILGIEEYLDGPVLSYINELGYVAFGFEAGQHDKMASIENCIAFIYLSAVFSGSISRKDIDFYSYRDFLAKNTDHIRNVYEIYFRYLIREEEDFRMIPGFHNFQKIREKQPLANSNGEIIYANESGRILMPLYQNQGTDGFFAIKRIQPFFLKLSEYLRKLKMDRLLAWLPGVSWLDDSKSALLVNKTIARFMAKDIFHLFGYRSVKAGGKYYKMYNREAAAKTEDYSLQPWWTD